jgi:hypothetical protein
MKMKDRKAMRVCNRPYHDDTHPELCVFEDALDIYLEPNAKLSKDAQRLRENLIDGVMLMAEKVSEFRTDESERKKRGKSFDPSEPYPSMPRSTTLFCPTTGMAYVVNEKMGLHFCPLHEYNEMPVTKKVLR